MTRKKDMSERVNENVYVRANKRVRESEKNIHK